MKAKELRDLNTDALNDKLIQLSREHLDIRIQKTSGSLNQSHISGQIKRDIARVKTIQNERSRDKS